MAYRSFAMKFCWKTDVLNPQSVRYSFIYRWRFKSGPFSKQNFIGYTYQDIRHIVFCLGNKLYSIKEEVLKLRLSDILSLVDT